MWLRWISRSGLKYNSKGIDALIGHLWSREYGDLSFSFHIYNIYGAKRVQGGSKGNWNFLDLSDELGKLVGPSWLPCGFIRLKRGGGISTRIFIWWKFSLISLVQGICNGLKVWGNTEEAGRSLWDHERDGERALQWPSVTSCGGKMISPSLWGGHVLWQHWVHEGLFPKALKVLSAIGLHLQI